nr:Dihydrofolate reductase [uncultured bacterium]
MIISAIVAMSQNRVIGVNNQLPWKIPEDLKRFKTLTLGHPVIMGRKTYESIGKVLPGRENIIITRQPHYSVPGATVVSSVEEAIRHCEGKSGEIFMIGGAEIYRQVMPKIQRLYLTLIEKQFEGDAFFPTWGKDEFKEVSREERSDPISFSFLVLERKK